jgi:hypothetical protein
MTRRRLPIRQLMKPVLAFAVLFVVGPIISVVECEHDNNALPQYRKVWPP